MPLPIERMEESLRRGGVSRFMEHFAALHPRDHLKDLTVDALGPGRRMVVGGREVVNFGSDSFLGLDQDPRVQAAIQEGVKRWGTHNGTSRAFASVAANARAEAMLADWLGAEATLIYPSVTLANVGAIPALVARKDAVVYDEHCHNSIQEGVKLARANGVRTAPFAHNDPDDLAAKLKSLRPYQFALVALDGVYSMSGELPPLREFDAIARANDAVLYVDDAHATAVMGARGRGTVPDALGAFENVLVVGSLSKGFSCLGGFIACPAKLRRQLKLRSSSYVFGGPVPPPYLEAICVVVDILRSDEYLRLRDRLEANLRVVVDGVARLGFEVLGGSSPIVSLLVGDEGDTLWAGRFLFDRGSYVQSVTFPAVPYHAGVLRIQVNANHTDDEVDGLLDALADLRSAIRRPNACRAA